MSNKISKLVKKRLVKNSIQNLTLLSIATAAVKRLSALDESKETTDAIIAFTQVLRHFPETGDGNKNTKACAAHLKALSPVLDVDNVLDDALVLCQLMQVILEDLTTRLKDPIRKLVLEQAVETTRALSDKLDPDGDSFDAYDTVDNALLSIYDELGIGGVR